MKKTFLLLLFFVLLAQPVYGAKDMDEGVYRQIKDQDQVQEPEGDAVRNENQKNQDTLDIDQEMLIQIQDAGVFDPEVLAADMEVVIEAQEEIKELAKLQEQEMEKLKSESGFKRMLFGVNQQALQNMRKHQEKTQEKIQQLNQLRTKIQNQASDNALQNAIQTMEEQNQRLADEIEEEEKSFSLFGWFFRLFRKNG